MSTPKEPETVPGTWYGDWNPMPIVEAIGFLKNPHEWTLEKASQLGCKVFKAHPGWRTVFVLDPVTAAHLLHCETTEFDHDEGFMTITIDFNRGLVNTIPSLLTPEGEDGNGLHVATRKFMIKSIHLRGYDRFLDLCNELLKDGLPQHRDAPSLRIGDTITEIATHIMFKWWMGIEGLNGAEVQDWAGSMVYTRGDTKLGKVFMPMLKRQAGHEMVDYSTSVITRIKEADTYPEFVKIANEVGLPEPNVAGNLLFSAIANASTPCYSVGQPGIAKLYLLPELRKRLEEEVDGITDAEALGKLPLLDAFFYESMREYGTPTRAARKALRDTTLPLSDGRSVKIDKGDEVLILNSAVRADTSVFGNTEEFDPDRFVKDPSLKEKVYAFGDTSTFGRERGFACPGAQAGMSSLLWKCCVVTFLRDPDASIEPKYEVDRSYSTNSTSPGDIAWNRKV